MLKRRLSGTCYSFFFVTSVITIATESVTDSIVMHSRHLVPAPENSITAISEISDHFLTLTALCLGVTFNVHHVSNCRGEANEWKQRRGVGQSTAGGQQRGVLPFRLRMLQQLTVIPRSRFCFIFEQNLTVIGLTGFTALIFPWIYAY